MIYRYRNMSLKDWYYEIRHQVRRVASFFIRGRRGWAPMDTWSLDRHVLKIMSEGMRHLAEHAHGFPSWIPEEYNLDTNENGETIDFDAAFECWQKWLHEQADWIDWYIADDLFISPEMSDFEKTAAINLYDKKYKTFKEVILPNIVKHIDSLWD